MEIKRSKTPDFNKFVGKPNQPYNTMERQHAMLKACHGALGTTPDEELSEDEIMDIFWKNPEAYSTEIFQNWGNEYFATNGWNMPLIYEKVQTSHYFKLNRMALYIKNNPVSEKN
jgi:hypothetical protein